MRPLPTIDTLVLKGTHNSYQCTGGTKPIMNHPPNVQIDDFGVWALELDPGVLFDIETRTWTVVVGHNSPGDGICQGWGFSLIDFLVAIRGTLAMRYRPVFIYFDIKDGFDGDEWIDLASDKCDDHTQKYGLIIQAVEQVFPGNVVQLYEFVRERNGKYPTIPEMAGKVIIYFPMLEFSTDDPNAICGRNPPPSNPLQGTLRGTLFDPPTTKGEVEAVIETGAPHNGTVGCGPEGCRVMRVDQYQADWTFDYGVPPYPLIVDSMAQPPYPAPNAVGDTWDCENGDVSHGEIVGEQGTWKFPFKTIGRAVTRAEGTTPPRQVGERIRLRESTRAGVGWVVLIKPGTYLESFKIDTPLTLQRDNGDGPVVIIGQQGRIVRSLWITFGTRNDGKDADTGLAVEVRAANGRVLARYQQRRDKEYGRFLSHTEQLQIDSPVFEAEMTSAVFTVDINPNGSDTWDFDWQLDGTWSDGQPFSDREIDISLDEDQPHHQKVLAI